MNDEFVNKLKDKIMPQNQVEPVPHLEDLPEAVKKFAPPAQRHETRLTVPQATADLYARKNSRTKLQTIAEFTSQLPFREAMTMARGILAKIKNKDGISEEQLAAAIQDWAWEGETFDEEKRPGTE